MPESSLAHLIYSSMNNKFIKILTITWTGFFNIILCNKNIWIFKEKITLLVPFNFWYVKQHTLEEFMLKNCPYIIIFHKYTHFKEKRTPYENSIWVITEGRIKRKSIIK